MVSHFVLVAVCIQQCYSSDSVLSHLSGVHLTCIVAKYNRRSSESVAVSRSPELTRIILAITVICLGANILDVLSLAMSLIPQGEEADIL